MILYSITKINQDSYDLIFSKGFRFNIFDWLDTYGSGVWNGDVLWRMYCVLWNTRNARLARKSRAVNKPAAGRRVNPVCFFKNSFISLSCGILSAVNMLSSCSILKAFLYSMQKCLGIRSKTLLKTAVHVLTSSAVYSMTGIKSPLL